MSDIERMLQPSKDWTVTHHGTRWVCAYCADGYLTKRGLRNHIERNHPVLPPSDTAPTLERGARPPQ